MKNCRNTEWVAWPGHSLPMPRPNWQTGYITLIYYPLTLQHLFSSRDKKNMKLDCVFPAVTHWQLMQLNQLRQECSDPSVSHPSGSRTTWPSSRGHKILSLCSSLYGSTEKLQTPKFNLTSTCHKALSELKFIWRERQLSSILGYTESSLGSDHIGSIWSLKDFCSL